jgi:hypothetical protein
MRVSPVRKRSGSGAFPRGVMAQPTLELAAPLTLSSARKEAGEKQSGECHCIGRWVTRF